MSARNLVTCKTKVTGRSLSGKVLLPQTRNCFESLRSFFSGSLAGTRGGGSAYCWPREGTKPGEQWSGKRSYLDCQHALPICCVYAKSKYCIHIYGRRQWQTEWAISTMQWVRMVQPRIRSGPRSFLAGRSATGPATPYWRTCAWEFRNHRQPSPPSSAWVKGTDGSNDMMPSNRQERMAAHDGAIRALRARSLDRAKTMKSKSRTAKVRSECLQVFVDAIQRHTMWDASNMTLRRGLHNSMVQLPAILFTTDGLLLLAAVLAAGFFNTVFDWVFLLVLVVLLVGFFLSIFSTCAGPKSLPSLSSPSSFGVISKLFLSGVLGGPVHCLGSFCSAWLAFSVGGFTVEASVIASKLPWEPEAPALAAHGAATSSPVAAGGNIFWAFFFGWSISKSTPGESGLLPFIITFNIIICWVVSCPLCMLMFAAPSSPCCSLRCAFASLLVFLRDTVVPRSFSHLHRQIQKKVGLLGCLGIL